MGVMLAALEDMFGVKHPHCFFCGYRMPENAPKFKSIHATVGCYMPYHEPSCIMMPSLQKILSDPDSTYTDGGR